MRTTSVPRWTSDTSEVESVLSDRSVACVLLIADSTVDDELVRGLTEKSVPATRTVRIGVHDDAATVLGDALAAARVGWRFVVLGEEASAGRLRSAIIGAGAVESEIVVVTTDDADMSSTKLRDVFCAHCHSITSADTRVDDSVECSSCRAELTVYYHYSWRHCAYLGYRADSEEL